MRDDHQGVNTDFETVIILTLSFHLKKKSIYVFIGAKGWEATAHA